MLSTQDFPHPVTQAARSKDCRGPRDNAPLAKSKKYPNAFGYALLASKPISTASPELMTQVHQEAPLDDNPLQFQAIGTLHTQPQQDNEGKFFLSVGGQRYRLFIPSYRFKPWLKQLSNHPDTPLFLRVYPKCLIIPKQEPLIRFELIAWGEDNQWDESPGLFKFRGIWQFVPQLRTPVISIYRNRNANDPSGKFKASHLPVLMRREDEVSPFKFNPKIPKEQLPQRWFIQARFKFIPNRNCWGWVNDLESPTEKFPKYHKPIKADMGNKEHR